MGWGTTRRWHQGLPAVGGLEPPRRSAPAVLDTNRQCQALWPQARGVFGAKPLTYPGRAGRAQPPPGDPTNVLRAGLTSPRRARLARAGRTDRIPSSDPAPQHNSSWAGSSCSPQHVTAPVRWHTLHTYQGTPGPAGLWDVDPLAWTRQQSSVTRTSLPAAWQ